VSSHNLLTHIETAFCIHGRLGPAKQQNGILIPPLISTVIQLYNGVDSCAENNQLEQTAREKSIS
jgi:hypothetical protein